MRLVEIDGMYFNPDYVVYVREAVGDDDARSLIAQNKISSVSLFRSKMSVKEVVAKLTGESNAS